MKIGLLSFFALCLMLICTAQKEPPRLLDQSMIIKKCDISVSVYDRLATTWVELEFYNNRPEEIEGRYAFCLNPGQAITGFQLMLGDKYRDGSIEERWKAQRAYSTVVGKRIDPALLQMTTANCYSLNIYPVPAKGMRKVKIKIEELLTCDSKGYSYNMNLLSKDSIGLLSVKADVFNQEKTLQIEEGLLKGKTFFEAIDRLSIQQSYQGIKSPAPVVLTIPGNCKSFKSCYKTATGDFFTITDPQIASETVIDIKKLRVYWDCSASMVESSKKDFIEYLKKVIKKYNPEQLTIVPFNQRLYGEKIFSGKEIKTNSWQEIIKQMSFEGATQFGILNFNTTDDAILVFTDGVNTLGRKKTDNNKVPVTFIIRTGSVSSNVMSYGYYYEDDFASYNPVNNSYRTYSLYNQDYDSVSINTLSKVNIYLIAVEDESGNKAEVELPQIIKQHMFIDGKLSHRAKKVLLKYGFGDKVVHIEEVLLEQDCFDADYEKAKALVKRNYLGSDWYERLDFGVSNKMITSQTAFIVFERIEDYVKFNITPPDDIMEQCMEKGFVKIDHKTKYKQMNKATELETIKLVANEYNKRISLLDANENAIDIAKVQTAYVIEREEADKTTQASVEKKAVVVQKPNTTLSTTSGDAKTMDDVVVMGYSVESRKNVSSSVSSLNSKQIKDVPVNSLGEALIGRLAGVNISQADGAPDANLNITIRGGGSISQSNEPLYIIDGIQVESGLSSLSPSDVQTVDVLKDASATAIYGARGANGVIIITTKSGRWATSDYNAKLKNKGDVDYMRLIKKVTGEEKYNEYKKMEDKYRSNMSFYLDMALHFYESGLGQYAEEMLANAAEASNGNVSSQCAIAFIYEHMKKFDNAIEIYKALADENNDNFRFTRDLAWAYYQNKQVDSAVNTLYRGIAKSVSSSDVYAIRMKDVMLADMNMMIALHKNEIDISYIPEEILKPIPADIRVIVESNSNDLTGMSFSHPRETIFNSKKNRNKQALRLQIADGLLAEFQVREAPKGRYGISVNSDFAYKYSPNYVRIIKIKDFGKPTQTIDTDIVSLGNQSGLIEIDDFKINETGK